MALLINAKLPMLSQVEAVRNLSILYYIYAFTVNILKFKPFFSLNTVAAHIRNISRITRVLIHVSHSSGVTVIHQSHGLIVNTLNQWLECKYTNTMSRLLVQVPQGSGWNTQVWVLMHQSQGLGREYTYRMIHV
jgi:hypothetical protein